METSLEHCPYDCMEECEYNTCSNCYDWDRCESYKEYLNELEKVELRDDEENLKEIFRLRNKFKKIKEYCSPYDGKIFKEILSIIESEE